LREPDAYQMMERSRANRVWLTVAVGVLGGVGMAVLASWAARNLWKSDPVAIPVAQKPPEIRLFRLPSGREHAAMICPAVPDGSGEQRLAAALFPGEETPRELASLLLANASDTETWDVDLGSLPLRFRVTAGSDWETFEALGDRLSDDAAALSASDRLRLRGLGAGSSVFRLEPRTSRRVLLALPRSRQFRELSDVEWGTTALTLDEVAVGAFRALRQDPSRAP